MLPFVAAASAWSLVLAAFLSGAAEAQSKFQIIGSLKPRGQRPAGATCNTPGSPQSPGDQFTIVVYRSVRDSAICYADCLRRKQCKSVVVNKPDPDSLFVLCQLLNVPVSDPDLNFQADANSLSSYSDAACLRSTRVAIKPPTSSAACSDIFALRIAEPKGLANGYWLQVLPAGGDGLFLNYGSQLSTLFRLTKSNGRLSVVGDTLDRSAIYAGSGPWTADNTFVGQVGFLPGSAYDPSGPNVNALRCRFNNGLLQCGNGSPQATEPNYRTLSRCASRDENNIVLHLTSLYTLPPGGEPGLCSAIDSELKLIPYYYCP